jgi:hypothetical protein
MVRLLDTQEEQYVHLTLAHARKKLMSSLTDTYAGYFSSLNCVSSHLEADTLCKKTYS